ncbi:Hypothetical protein A7982_08039 [Minicystis rosea]|nr:Hypothetical protein A7982_08039 [Minicystis rosea]
MALGPPGKLTILQKGTSRVVQQLHIASLPERASAPGYEPSVLVDDFDFDGHEDFALHTGDAGDGETYSVFLFVPASRTFVLSRALSQLTELSLAPLQVDAARKRLIIASNRGCCNRWAEEYAVHQRFPLLMRRETESKGTDGGCLTIEMREKDGVMRQQLVHCKSPLAVDPFRELQQ